MKKWQNPLDGSWEGISLESGGYARIYWGFIQEVSAGFVIFSQNECPQNPLCGLLIATVLVHVEPSGPVFFGLPQVCES